MNIEKLREILAKYGITLDQMAIDNIMAISQLPTSDILKLFNEIAIEDVFSPREMRLF